MKRFQLMLAVFAAVLLLMCPFFSAFAADGSGSGDQTGKEEGLTLQSSSVVDGDRNVSVRPVIELVFSGKVDDILVLALNKDCFHLQSGAGDVLALQVLFPDTQVQNRFQRHVFLTPESALEPEQSYTLTIDRTLADKKGHTLVSSYQIRFTTADDEAFATLKENEDLIALGDNTLAYSTALLPNAADAAEAGPADNSAENAGQNGDGPSVQTIIRVAVPVLLLVLAAVFYSNWKKTHGTTTE